MNVTDSRSLLRLYYRYHQDTAVSPHDCGSFIKYSPHYQLLGKHEIPPQNQLKAVNYACALPD